MADDEVFWSPDVLAEYDDTCTFIPTNNRNKSKSKKNKKNKDRKQNSVTRTDQPDLQSYWLKRYAYFSRYDHGVLIDRTGWFSVTPESTAAHIASFLTPGSLVYDGFAGIGGNAVQFAAAGMDVIATEVDPVRAAMCRHNVRIYDLHAFVDVLTADYYQFTSKSSVKADVVFLSPPWGGPAVNKQPVFRLDTMNGRQIFECAKRVAPNVIYYLPRHTSITDIASLAPQDLFRIVIHREEEGGEKVVAISALFGPMFTCVDGDGDGVCEYDDENIY